MAHAAVADPVFLRAPVEYRGWTIYRETTVLGTVFIFGHEDEEPMPDGEGGWIDGERSGSGASIEDVKAQIDAILAEDEVEDDTCETCGGEGAYLHDGRTPQHASFHATCEDCKGTDRRGFSD